jgi:hypothetical protein
MGRQTVATPTHCSSPRWRSVRRCAWIGLLLWPVLAGRAPVVSAEPVATSRSELVAVRIDARNAQRTIQGGPDAIGGVDDWALQNGTLCAVVADPSHESDLAATGGGLVDLGFCGRDDDQFILYQELLNNSLSDPVPAESVAAEVDARVARLVVRGGRDGVAVETRYELDMAVPRRLRIETRVSRGEGAMRLYGFAGALANVQGLTPFGIAARSAAISRGYVHPSYKGRGLSAISRAATPADLVVAVGAEELQPGIAYGQRLVAVRLENDTGEAVPLPHFFLSDSLATVVATFARRFWIGDGSALGRLQMLQTRLMNLAPGRRLVLEQELWVGERADVSSVTDLLWSDAGRLVGRVDDARAVVHVDRSTGEPVTQVRAGADGRFAVRLPAGAYRLRVGAPGGRETERAVSVGDSEVNVGLLAVGPPARVTLPRNTPMRLVFLGIDGTLDPDFHDDLRGYAMSGDQGVRPGIEPERDVHLTGTPFDPPSVTLRPGRYRVLATRGPEFSLTEAEIEIAAGDEMKLAIALPEREVETPGWIASDFHIHSAPSLDNPTAPERRVASYVAQGAEVLISSEHDHVYDFAQTIQKLDLDGRLASVVGIEVTSEVRTKAMPHSIGHANVFPVPRDPLAYRRGAVANEARRWRDVIADLRALPGERVIQLNHARSDEPGIAPRAFLSHMGPAAAAFDPEKSLSEPPNAVLAERDPRTGLRDLDFDAMELMNGHRMQTYELLREDWFALLRQGERLAGTANSDSHFLSRPAASPRNYVRLAVDAIEAFDTEAFVQAVRAGRMYGTTGPLVDIALADAEIGETFRGRSGVLRGSIRAASWVPVSELRVFVSGRPVETRPIASNQPFEISLTFERDAFVTVEVRGEATGDYAAVLPHFVPLAFTNPIWVDADGDGVWSPPGVGGE